MKKQILAAMMAAVVMTPAAMPTAAVARRHHDYRWDGDRGHGRDPADHYRGGHYRERRLSRNDRIYRGRDGRYYCRRDNDRPDPSHVRDHHPSDSHGGAAPPRQWAWRQAS